MWYWWKSRQTDQCNRTESSEKDPQIQSTNLWKRQFNGERIVFQQMVLEQLDSHVQKNKQKPSQSCPCSPVYRHQPPPLSLGSMCQLSWQMPIYLPSPPSSPFHAQPLPSQVKTLRTHDNFYYQCQVFAQCQVFPLQFLPLLLST